MSESIAPSPGMVLLFGAPGVLRDVPGLASFPHLESLWLDDLFGYAPADFPAPDKFPALAISVPFALN